MKLEKWCITGIHSYRYVVIKEIGIKIKWFSNLRARFQSEEIRIWWRKVQIEAHCSFLLSCHCELHQSIVSGFIFDCTSFTDILEGLVSTGRLNGSISGGRQDRASYVPDIYARTQNNWVDSFYKQNGYLGRFLGNKHNQNCKIYNICIVECFVT